MMKTEQAKRSLYNKGYKVEWQVSPRGKKICCGIKEGCSRIYATNLIKLDSLTE